MSDLQIYLLALGVVIILAVLIVNRVQEKRFKSKLNHSPDLATEDPLLDRLDTQGSITLTDSEDEMIAAPEGISPGQESAAASIPVSYEGEDDVALDLELLDSKITFQIAISASEGLCISTTGQL